MKNQILVYSESQLLLEIVSNGSKYNMVSLFKQFGCNKKSVKYHSITLTRLRLVYQVSDLSQYLHRK